jgi:hypothetical protein
MEDVFSSAVEAYGYLVGPLVFKTSGRRSASSAGSIPVRLRQWSRRIVGVGMHVIATAGHVDHGKSTLVRALTGEALELASVEPFADRSQSGVGAPVRRSDPAARFDEQNRLRKQIGHEPKGLQVHVRHPPLMPSVPV